MNRIGYAVLGALLAFLLSVPVVSWATLEGPAGDYQESGLPLSGGKMSGDIDMGTSHIDSTDSLLMLGADMTSTHGLGTGAVGVAGALEVDGALYADAGFTVPAAQSIFVGTSVYKMSTAQTPDSLILGVAATSNALLITEYADNGTDFAFPLQTNPTLVIQSADATTPAQRLTLAHNQTAGVVGTGAGIIDLEPTAKGVGLPTITGTGAPTEPVSCTAANAGVTVYVDDTDDSAAAEICVCAATTDDGAGIPTMDWVQMANLGAACSFF